MGVPGQDERDWEFAETYGLEIVRTVQPPSDFGGRAYTGDGPTINSGFLNGLWRSDALRAILAWLDEHRRGHATVQYKLSDWIFRTVPADDPPSGQALAASATPWPSMTWHHLRCLSPSARELVDPVQERYWMPVDLLIGRADDWLPYLLHARVIHKLLHQLGVTSASEPFRKIVSVEPSEANDGETARALIANHGADALRLAATFAGPLEQTSSRSGFELDGAKRFLNRVWRLGDRVRNAEPSKEQICVLNGAVAKVSGDVEALRFNTAIAALMELTNVAQTWQVLPASIAEGLVLLLSPFAPHLAAEIWQRLGHRTAVDDARWPEADPRYAVADRIELVVQVNGRPRGTIQVAADTPREAVLAAARAQQNVARHLAGQSVRREVLVPGRTVNFVTDQRTKPKGVPHATRVDG
jgi:leucyl-tRNA synthetase